MDCFLDRLVGKINLLQNCLRLVDPRPGHSYPVDLELVEVLEESSSYQNWVVFEVLEKARCLGWRLDQSEDWNQHQRLETLESLDYLELHPSRSLESWADMGQKAGLGIEIYGEEVHKLLDIVWRCKEKMVLHCCYMERVLYNRDCGDDGGNVLKIRYIKI